ncbi:hypothetical protein C0Q70_04140 [Pomacea canaliculata]|uniref:Uncharacterized protein n=1 Tax=Pomacea canaliculata TaxID=400727 RepID=A0A2T7PUP1_POMCA|nr:hypothetical protein C0Q70_04140 [Pomacea canaliculata]
MIGNEIWKERESSVEREMELVEKTEEKGVWRAEVLSPFDALLSKTTSSKNACKAHTNNNNDVDKCSVNNNHLDFKAAQRSLSASSGNSVCQVLSTGGNSNNNNTNKGLSEKNNKNMHSVQNLSQHRLIPPAHIHLHHQQQLQHHHSLHHHHHHHQQQQPQQQQLSKASANLHPGIHPYVARAARDSPVPLPHPVTTPPDLPLPAPAAPRATAPPTPTGTRPPPPRATGRVGETPLPPADPTATRTLPLPKGPSFPDLASQPPALHPGAVSGHPPAQHLPTASYLRVRSRSGGGGTRHGAGRTQPHVRSVRQRLPQSGGPGAEARADSGAELRRVVGQDRDVRLQDGGLLACM